METNNYVVIKKDGFDNERVLVVPRNVVADYCKNPFVSMLYVTDIGYYPKAEGHYRRRPNGSEQYIFIYCTDGEGWYDLGEGKVKVRKNDYFIIKARQPHSYGASQQEPWSIYWVHFSGSQSKMFSPLFNKLHHVPNSATSRFEERVLLFDEMIFNLEMGYGTEILEYVSICLMHFLGSFRYFTQFCEINKPKPQTIVERTITMMKANLNHSLSLEDFASALCVSPNYLSAVFSHTSGMSLVKYYNLLKIRKACFFLDFTDKSIKEIADWLDYSDQYYFSRVFSKYMLMSPTAYRNRRNG